MTENPNSEPNGPPPSEPPETLDDYLAQAAAAWDVTLRQCREAAFMSDLDVIRDGAPVQFQVYCILTERFRVEPKRALMLARDTIDLPDPPAALTAYLDSVAESVRDAVRCAPAEATPEAREALACSAREIFREAVAALVREHGARERAAADVAYRTITGALDGRALLH